ncbi:hypothetical protein H072_9997 [Dactylellina haptotyla CBS 200.50]|uniref:Rieske domain-containing protein n=1 Tax=Dactylellina haptotyla (strain CBS 200.50) TaxID=1284197 RepID=S8A166_DACHA|nr:hypothetical protein H072_9997 [Dactylellina haptotyla CBS 200.50]
MMPRNENLSNPGLCFTSGRNDPVWTQTNPYASWPIFNKLAQDLETHTVVIGAGFAGVSTAYELIQRGVKVVLLEAREVTSGESGRSNGSLSACLGMKWADLIKRHGIENAKQVYNSHCFAIDRVEDIVRNHGIDCDYRKLACRIFCGSEENVTHEVEAYSSLEGQKNLVCENGEITVRNQAVFHPTKYVHAVLREMASQNPELFSCYTQTRVKIYKAVGNGVVLTMEEGHSIKATNMIMTVGAPVQGYPDIQVNAASHPDENLKYLIVTGGKHKTGHINSKGYDSYFERLQDWTSSNFPTANREPDYRWSSQIIDSNDHLPYIGREKPGKNIFVITGSSGSLTYGLIGAKIIADQITGVPNPWEAVYDASRIPKSKLFGGGIEKIHLEELVQKSREERTYITDIEDLPLCEGTIMLRNNEKDGMPLAVWKDKEGKTRTFTAVCPHAYGILVWNGEEQTFDCPLHGSRFDAETGRCVSGPANRGLTTHDEAAKEAAAASVQL